MTTRYIVAPSRIVVIKTRTTNFAGKFECPNVASRKFSSELLLNSLGPSLPLGIDQLKIDSYIES